MYTQKIYIHIINNSHKSHMSISILAEDKIWALIQKSMCINNYVDIKY